ADHAVGGAAAEPECAHARAAQGRRDARRVPAPDGRARPDRRAVAGRRAAPGGDRAEARRRSGGGQHPAANLARDVDPRRARHRRRFRARGAVSAARHHPAAPVGGRIAGARSRVGADPCARPRERALSEPAGGPSRARRCAALRMIRSYLKISIAVLKRRKFLTFVNLFGTVLTLSTLVTGFAVLESMLSPDGAQRRQAHILVVNHVGLIGENQANRSGPGWAFYERYIEPMQSPDKTSFATAGSPGSSYVDGREITSVLRRTDAAYWTILDFDLLDGRTLAPDDVDRGRFVAVIN